MLMTLMMMRMRIADDDRWMMGVMRMHLTLMVIEDDHNDDDNDNDKAGKAFDELVQSDES